MSKKKKKLFSLACKPPLRTAQRGTTRVPPACSFWQRWQHGNNYFVRDCREHLFQLDSGGRLLSLELPREEEEAALKVAEQDMPCTADTKN